jgi:glutamate dehydrogenase/leucine dehydrogenase
MDVTQVGDTLGPAKVLFVREARTRLDAVIVVDNVACGAAVGGIRMAPDVDARETLRLARAMTLKNAAAGLPHGGAKAAIVHDPTCTPKRKQELVRAFARAMRDISDYIPGPDMGTDERCMAWIHDEIGRAVGLPRVLGGIPLDEIGATGFGLAIAAEVAAPAAGFELAGARVAIQGFGAVGQHAARFLAERGARLVAASDSRVTVFNAAGISITDLIVHKRAGSLAQCSGVECAERDAILGVDCDIWIPAARPDVLDEARARALRARLVLQGANIPATPAAESALHERGVLNIPDFIANAGGVICAAVELRGGTEQQAFATIETKIRANLIELLGRVQQQRVPPREAALNLAEQRVLEAMSYRAA